MLDKTRLYQSLSDLRARVGNNAKTAPARRGLHVPQEFFDPLSVGQGRAVLVCMFKPFRAHGFLCAGIRTGRSRIYNVFNPSQYDWPAIRAARISLAELRGPLRRVDVYTCFALAAPPGLSIGRGGRLRKRRRKRGGNICPCCLRRTLISRLLNG